jgi:hypothetical protein
MVNPKIAAEAGTRNEHGVSERVVSYSVYEERVRFTYADESAPAPSRSTRGRRLRAARIDRR